MISSPALVKDLMDRKSNIYSSRPPSYVSDTITRGDHILIRTNDNLWRLQRKLVHQYFNETRCEKDYLTLQNAEAVQMLRDTCLAPEQFMYHPKRFSNSIIMSLGKSVSSVDLSMLGRPSNIHVMPQFLVYVPPQSRLRI